LNSTLALEGRRRPPSPQPAIARSSVPASVRRTKQKCSRPATCEASNPHLRFFRSAHRRQPPPNPHDRRGKSTTRCDRPATPGCRSRDTRASRWVVQDYGDVVVHVFDAEARTYYQPRRPLGGRPRLDWTRISPFYASRQASLRACGVTRINRRLRDSPAGLIDYGPLLRLRSARGRSESHAARMPLPAPGGLEQIERLTDRGGTLVVGVGVASDKTICAVSERRGHWRSIVAHGGRLGVGCWFLLRGSHDARQLGSVARHIPHVRYRPWRVPVPRISLTATIGHAEVRRIPRSGLPRVVRPAQEKPAANPQATPCGHDRTPMSPPFPRPRKSSCRLPPPLRYQGATGGPSGARSAQRPPGAGNGIRAA